MDLQRKSWRVAIGAELLIIAVAVLCALLSAPKLAALWLAIAVLNLVALAINRRRRSTLLI